MTELTFNIIKQAFKNQSITERDYLGSEELYNIISKLNKSQFDEETYEQIWDQCKLNSKGEVRISDFIEVLLKGEALLIEKQQENTYEIAKLENEKKGKLIDFSDQHKYKELMDALTEEKIGVANSLSIIRKPFIIPTDLSIRDSHPATTFNPNQRQRQEIQQNDIVRQLFEYDSSETASTLMTIFYITSTLTVLAWLASFFICQFLSMIAYTFILSQFTFQIISRKLIKFNLIILLACTFFDILWLILETGNIWYLPDNFQLAHETSSYLKFSIILIILCVCLRLVLMYYYLSQFHLDEFQVYAIKVLGKDLNIQRETEPYTANKNPFSLFLEPYFNKAVVEGEPIQ